MTKDPKWIEKARDVHNFHVAKVRENAKWRSIDTAKALRMSIGAVSEYLLVASWLKTHRPQIEKFEYVSDVLEWIRERKIKQQTESLDL